MSSVYLLVALLATFAAVALMSMRLGLQMAARRRTLRLLRDQTAVVTVSNLREQELAESLVARLLAPVARRFTGIGARIVGADGRDKIEQRLLRAGSPPGWDAERVGAFKVIGALAAGVFGIMWGGGLVPKGMLLGLAVGLFGFFVPDLLLINRAQKRQQQMLKELPDTMDLLTISVEAGLGFDAAMAQVVETVDGPLSQEFARLLHEMRIGVSRSDAFRNLTYRVNIDELRSFAVAMIQADQFGVSISGVLRSQARDQRTKRRQRAEERAMKVPVKILFPLIFCVFPALFVVIIGPGVIRIIEEIFGRV